MSDTKVVPFLNKEDRDFLRQISSQLSLASSSNVRATYFTIGDLTRLYNILGENTPPICEQEPDCVATFIEDEKLEDLRNLTQRKLGIAA